MYTKQPKKLLIINILDILRRHSDEHHRLSQKQMLEILKDEYDMVADRKSIKRNLMNLIDFGYNIEFSETTRKNKDGEDETIYTDWYLVRDFSDAELRLLIDSLLFSKHIPHSHCKQLIEKISALSSKHFRAKVRHIHNLPIDKPQNPHLFYTIEILDEAIETGMQVAFNYGDYKTDKNLHLRKNDDGENRRYVVNPYQMVAANGSYYLIGNYDKYDNISHYRVDHIMNIEISDTPAKPKENVKGLEHGLDLPKHMAEHIYMYAGESQRVEMKTTPDMAGELINWFGNGVTFSQETKDSLTAHVTVNLGAMRYWALQYAPYVTITKPQSLVDDIKKDLKEAIAKYEEV